MTTSFEPQCGQHGLLSFCSIIISAELLELSTTSTSLSSLGMPSNAKIYLGFIFPPFVLRSQRFYYTKGFLLLSKKLYFLMGWLKIMTPLKFKEPEKDCYHKSNL